MACADCVCITGAKDELEREYAKDESCIIVPRGCPCPVYPDINAPDTWLPADSVPYGTIPPQALDQGHPIIPLPQDEMGVPLPVTDGWFTVPTVAPGIDSRNDGRYTEGGLETFIAQGEVDGTPGSDFEFVIPVNGDPVYVIDVFDSGGFDAPVTSTVIDPLTYVPANLGSITNDRTRDMLLRVEYRTGSAIQQITNDGGVDTGLVTMSGINDASVPDRSQPFLTKARTNASAGSIDISTTNPALWPIEVLLIPGDTFYAAILGVMAVTPAYIGVSNAFDLSNMRFGWIWSIEAQEIEGVSGASIYL